MEEIGDLKLGGTIGRVHKSTKREYKRMQKAYKGILVFGYAKPLGDAISRASYCKAECRVFVNIVFTTDGT